MGEILRGVMDSRAQYSGPVYYGVNLLPSGPILGLPTQPYRGFVQIKADSYFLMTSIYLRNDGNNVSTTPLSFAAADANRRYIDVPPISADLTEILTTHLNDNINSCFTLPEYILWKPKDIVVVSSINREPLVITAPIPQAAVLIGLEYKF